MVAAGTINPITGRNYVKTWMADDLWAKLEESYQQITDLLNQQILKPLPIIRSLHSIKEENTWLGRVHDVSYLKYISEKCDAGNISSQIEKPFSMGEIIGAQQLNVKKMLPAFKSYWQKKSAFVEDEMDYTQLENLGKTWKYKDISAENIVFCEGHKTYANPYFNHLSFDPVKGEALIIELQEPFDKSLRDKTFITPLGEGLHHWCGSGYSKNFEDEKPTTIGREEIESQLKNILRVPYKIVDQVAGVRPSTKFRRPFLGRHDLHHNLFIFNGLGTKGSSLGPYFAAQMVDFMVAGIPINEEVICR